MVLCELPEFSAHCLLLFFPLFLLLISWSFLQTCRSHYFVKMWGKLCRSLELSLQLPPFLQFCSVNSSTANWLPETLISVFSPHETVGFVWALCSALRSETCKLDNRGAHLPCFSSFRDDSLALLVAWLLKTVVLCICLVCHVFL